MPFLDVLSLLNPLVWRGVEVPAAQNDLSFEHGQAEHYQYGVDGALVEHTGRKSVRFSFTIPFRAGISQYPDLYPHRYREFWNACNDGSTGLLQHPELGVFDAKVVSFRQAVSPERRDGYDVDVMFIETVEDDGVLISDNATGPVDFAINLGEDLERIVGAADLPEDDDSMTLGQAVDGIRKGIAQVKGSLMLADITISNMVGQIGNVVASVNDAIDTVNTLTTPSSWEIADTLKRIEAKLQETKQRLAPKAKKIDFVIAPREVAVSDAAASGGMALDEFLRLNPRLAKSRTIAAGKSISWS